MSQVTAAELPQKSAKKFVADSFSKSVVLISCLMIVQRGIGFLRSFFVCGTLSPAEVGQWDLAFNFLMLVAPLSVLGIPGSFGRYLARFEKHGQQRKFLAQTTIACLGLVAAASMLLIFFRATVAQYFFGDPADTDLVTLLAIGLPCVVFFNFSSSWFAGRRLNRLVFRIQFTQTLFFALLCVAMFKLYSASAVSVVVAYLLSCLAGTVLAAGYAMLADPHDQASADQGKTEPIWGKLLTFAVWVWVSDAMINLFTLCDRLLIVNFHSGGDVDVQSLIGQYHTACLFPLLLMSIGAMAGSTGMPYLSKDWEAGNREAVADRMNLMLKVIGLFCVFASVAILFVAPILFGQIWKDKFAMGESLLPMALCYCSLAAMSMVAQNYFWCIEKTWISSLFLLVALVANFVVGIALVGPYGINGVVASTLVAHALVLAGVLLMCRRLNLRIDSGVFLVAAGLLLLCLGKVAAIVCLTVLAIVSVYTSVLFCDSDRQKAFAKIRAMRTAVVGILS